MPNAFVHLHVHSDYTVLQGACRIALSDDLQKQPDPPETLPQRAAAMGFSAVALTDRNALYGALAFYKACREADIKPILGCEFVVAAGDRKDRRAFATEPEGFHLTVLAESRAGYLNLVKLVSAAHLEAGGRLPRIDRDLLREHSAGLVVLSGDSGGEAAFRFARGDEVGARRALESLVDIFGPAQFYVELLDHGLDAQKHLNRFLVAEARRLGARVVATNDVHYLRREDAEVQDILVCLGQGAFFADESRERYGSDERYLKSPDEMAERFSGLPEALASTLEIAERCNVEIELGKNRYPAYPAPEGETREQMLRRLCAEGLASRYPGAFEPGHEAERGELEARLEYEVGVLERMGFTSYFLIVWDFIHFARQHGIPVGPGRGSAAGSLVAYALRITDVDPVRFGLIFERFLNPERISPPDIDVDFCYNRRPEVIEYVRGKYGADRVAQIITFGTLGAKAAVRDVSRVLGFAYLEGDRLAKMIPNAPDMTLQRAIDESPDLRNACESEPNARRIIDAARSIEGMVRQVGVHAAGVVIADHPLSEDVPLAVDANGGVVTQYDMNMLTEVGMLKMDFLGLRNLTVIRDALDLIGRHRGVALTEDQIPFDDPKTFALLDRGQGTGIFQLESPGMRNLCRQFGVRTIDDLVALIALYRPGSMSLVPEFVSRRQGQVQIEYEHPLLEQCCADTLGIMIYQEQVMKAASVLAGYSPGAADLLRRAMGKKDKAKMAKERERFIEGCAATNAIPRAKAGAIFDLIEKFAGYGFNKSHSAAYGVVAYWTAWLKANHPVEFMAALMSNDLNDIDKIAEFRAECRTMGIPVRPPSVNLSGARFTVEGDAIRYGLAAIKGVGESAVELLVRQRESGGPFGSVEDICHRCDTHLLNKRVIEALAKAGALDEIEPSRRVAFERADAAIASAAGIHRDAQRGQTSLFGNLAEIAPAPRNDGTGEDWPAEQRLAFEKEVLGGYLSGHPIQQFSAKLAAFELPPIASLRGCRDGAMVRAGGFMRNIEMRLNKEKRPFLRCIFEDAADAAEILVTAGDFDRLRPEVVDGRVALVAGQLDLRGDRPVIRAQEIVEIGAAARRFAEAVEIRVPRGVNWEALDALVRRSSGACRLLLCIPARDSSEAVLEADGHFAVQPSDSFEAEVARLAGPGAITWIPARRPPLPKSRSQERPGGRFNGRGGFNGGGPRQGGG
ncbi:MAG: DNA polymerase III subunit alpha [Verrucomicrobiae bacterium]|nr:DNA polymerase III subunit alpha [Verrucomicrobiae bacterium]